MFCCSCCLQCVVIVVVASVSLILFFFFLLLFHQRCSSTSLSNSTECFYVPWSWTDHLPSRDKRHRKQSQWLLSLFIEWIYSLHRKISCRKEHVKSYTKTLSFHRLPVLQYQLWCNISSWPLSVGCWSREFISTSSLWKFTTLTPRCTCITSSHGVSS